MADGGGWDLQRCRSILLPVEVEEVSRLEKLDHTVEDVRYWRFDQGGEYKVKTGYLVASSFFEENENSSSEETCRWWKYLWSFDLPQRIKIFAWRVFRNIIPTEVNLARHHVPVFGRCGWCNKGWGSTAHTLLYCEKVKGWWRNFEFWKDLKKLERFEIEYIGEVMRRSSSRDNFELWLVGMWIVWKALCAEKHKEASTGWDDLPTVSRTYIENYVAARAQQAIVTRLLPNEGSMQWERPKPGRYRLDVDYGYDEERGVGGVGAIARDSSGSIVFALAKPVHASSSVLHGEIKGMMHGIRQCIEEGLSPVEVYSDSMLAVLAVREENEEVSVLYEDLFEFFSMVKNLNVISIEHTRREANQAAHELARLARQLETTNLWHDSWPVWLLRIVQDDIA